MRAAVPGPGLVLATSGTLEPLLAAAATPGDSPIPRGLETPGSADLAIWIPEPFSGLVARLYGEAMDVPARGLLIEGRPEARASGQTGPLADGVYVLRVVFLMTDADSARIFRPALKLAWYGFSKAFLGNDAEAALGAAFSLNGNTYSAEGIRVSSAAIASALSRLKGLLERGEKPL